MKSVRAVVTGSVLACVGMLAVVAHAAPQAAPPSLVQLGTTGEAFAFPSSARVTRAEVAEVSVSSLLAAQPGQAVLFTLFDDVHALGTVTHRRDVGPGRLALAGTIPGQPAGDFVIITKNGLAAASIRLGGPGEMRLRPVAGGGHVLEQIDEAQLPGCGIDALDPADAPPPDEPAGGAAGDCDDGSQIDVMVVYTPAARFAAGGIGPMEALIDLAVANANAAYVNSEINPQLNLVLTGEVDYDESESHLSVLTNPNDGVIDGVHILRDALGADLVAMYVDQAGYCGIAWLLPGLSTGYANIGFSVTVWDCASLVFAHELGHNEGCCHAPGDGGGCNSGGIFDYSLGYRFFGDSTQLFRTIMAYNPGARIPNFSNPDVLHDGQPTGVGGIDDPRENARTINETAFTIANFRCPSDICDDLLDIPGDCNDNGVADACEIAIGYSEDINANELPDECEPVTNDTCLAATLLSAGQTPFTTEVALTESPFVPGCGTVLRDVWFKVFAFEPGYLTVATADSSFTTSLVMYDGCPGGGGQILGCTSDGAAEPLVVPVQPGSYRLRLGADTEVVGEGMVLVGFSPHLCPADFDGTGEIDIVDALALLDAWGSADALYDIAPVGGDGIVDLDDLEAVLLSWGVCE